MPSPNFLIYGRATPPAEPLRLRAGLLAMEFHPESAALRRLTVDQTEVIRAIYVAVRDRNWGTVPATVIDLKVEAAANSFRLSVEVECRQPGIRYRWRGDLNGTAEGSVSFRFTGEALTEFERNRIGLCVLHPLAGCATRPVEIEHTDGRLERTSFPEFVSPHQPFLEVRAITHEPRAGVRVLVRYEGEVFETEDQRNWTDASFKTYCPPLKPPLPVLVRSGERLLQTVEVQLLGTAAEVVRMGHAATPGSEAIGRTREKVAKITLGSDDGRGSSDKEVPGPMVALPRLGLCQASHGQPLQDREVAWLRRLGLDHLRAEIEFHRPHWPVALARAAEEARRIGCGLHLALFLTDQFEAELAALVEQSRDLPVRLWLLFHSGSDHTPSALYAPAVRMLRDCRPDVPIAAGTNAFFAEVNRQRPPAEHRVWPCYSLNPQGHAVDALTLVENLEGQAETVRSAHRFSGQPVVCSPITLKTRFQPPPRVEGTDQPSGRPALASEAVLPPQVDPRQMSLFGAAWTLGSVAQICSAGAAHSATYYETTGWRGVLERAQGSPQPALFPSIAAGVFPMFHVFAWLAGYSRAVPMGAGGEVVGLELVNPAGRRRLLLGNLAPEPLELQLTRLPEMIRLKVLDGANVEAAMREPEEFLDSAGPERSCPRGEIKLRLGAYGLVCLDWE